MFQSFASMMLRRNPSIKGQKLVGEVVEQLGVKSGQGGGQGGGAASGGFNDGSGSTDKQNGLVRVRIRDLHDGWPKEALPITQMKGGFGSGNGQGTTDEFKQLAPVGSKVFAEFENNSQYHPVYQGGSGTEDKKVKEFTGDNYGHTYGRVDPGGNLVKTNTKEGEEDYTRQHVSGTTHNMDKDGNYNISAAKNFVAGGEAGKMQFDKDHTIEAGGDGHLKYGGKLIIEASEIEFRHGGARSTTPITLGGGAPSKPGNRTKPTKRTRPTYKSPGMKV